MAASSPLNVPDEFTLHLRLSDDRQAEEMIKRVAECLEAVERLEGRYRALYGMYQEVLTAVGYLRQDLAKMRK